MSMSVLGKDGKLASVGLTDNEWRPAQAEDWIGSYIGIPISFISEWEWQQLYERYSEGGNLNVCNPVTWLFEKGNDSHNATVEQDDEGWYVNVTRARVNFDTPLRYHLCNAGQQLMETFMKGDKRPKTETPVSELWSDTHYIYLESEACKRYYSDNSPEKETE